MTDPFKTPENAFNQPAVHVNAWRVLVAICLAAITISWLAPFYETLTRGGLGADMGMIVLALSLVIGMAYLADLAVEFLRLRSNARVAVQVGLLLISGYLAMNRLVWQTPGYNAGQWDNFLVFPELVGMAAIWLAWWRGQSLSQHQVGTIRIQKAFRYGIWLHLLTGFIRYRVAGDLSPMPFYIFLFVGLVGLGSARLATVGSLRGGHGVPFDRGLVAGISGTAGGLILASSVVALWAGGPLASFVRRILGGLVSGLAEVVFIILGPVIRWFINLLEMIGGPNVNILPQDDTFDPNRMGDTVQQALSELSEEITPPTWAADLGQIVKYVLIGIAILVILLIIYAGLRQWRRMGKLSIRSDSESLISLSDLPRLFQQAVRQRLRSVVDGFQKLRPSERRYAAARIRRIYAELMQLSQRLEMGRPKALTPLEFLPKLKTLYGSEDEALELITRAYLKVRYGELPETRQQIDEVESAWVQVESRGKDLYRQAHGRLGLS